MVVKKKSVKKAVNNPSKKAVKTSSKKKVVKKTSVKKDVKTPVAKMRTKECCALPGLSLENSAYAGIIAFFLSLMVAFMATSSLDSKSQVIVYCIVGVLAGIFTSIYVLGFVELGRRIKDEYLRIAGLLFLGLAIVDVIYLLMTSLTYLPRSSFAGLFFVVVYGAAAIVFGRSLYRLSHKFGGLAKFAGVMNILVGVFSLTIILAGLGVFLSVFAEILNILVLFKASRVMR